MNHALSPVSEAIVALHSHFIVERILCREPAHLPRRFAESVDCTRASLPVADRAYFDLRIAVIRAELFRECEKARASHARVEAAA